MRYYPEAVMLNDKVYNGAGNTFNGLSVTSTVMVYNVPNHEWSLLPVYDYYWFGMTSLDNKLVLIGGGVKGTEKRTNKLGVWDDKWVNTILPPMPTARSGPTMVTYKNRWLVVSGGYCDFSVRTVEILDTLTGYWHCASPLPEPQYKMSSTLIRNMWYLLGGYSYSGQQTLCICICIDDLIYQAVFQPIYSPSLWQCLPDTLSVKCTALSLDGALLAVGGVNYPFINVYKPSTKSWMKVGELSSARHVCACTVLPNGQLLILGRNTTLRMSAQATNIVEIGTVLNS